MRKTKIICTLGPASGDEETIEALAKAGMNVARINFSHGTHREHKEKMDRLMAVRKKTGLPLALLLDTRGPEIRLENFSGDKATLQTGQKFSLSGVSCLGDEAKASTTYDKLWEILDKGDKVLIDDGKIELKVDEIAGKDVRCTVMRGGNVSSQKGVNLPGIKVKMEYLRDKDRSDLLLGIQKQADYVAASFVRRGEDVRELRLFLDENGGKAVGIIAKIENQEGIDNIHEILEFADGIMVARGDMGVEVEFEKIPGIQKKLIHHCRKRGKTAITATQMLESMTDSPTPTRAEITDVANAVFDGTSAVMLSEETAVGKYPVETVEAMVKILTQGEKDALEFHLFDHFHGDPGEDVSDGVGRAACEAAKSLDAKGIIAITIGGSTAERMAKYRPLAPIIAATPDPRTFYKQALTWGTYPLMTEYTEVWDDLMKEAMDKTVAAGLVKKGDLVVLSGGMPLRISGNTNLILIQEVV